MEPKHCLYADKKNEIAIVLTDMVMPFMDGPATIRALQRMNPRVRIIAASGLGAGSMQARVVGRRVCFSE